MFDLRNVVRMMAIVVGTVAFMAGLGALAQTTSAGLKAGATRVDITPTTDEMAAPFKTVADHVYVRALVVDDGQHRVVVVVAEAPTIAAKAAADLTQQIAASAHVPVENVLLGSTHTHNSMRLDSNGMGSSLPGSTKYMDHVVTATMKAVDQAQANMQPARVGYATGSAALIANRNQWNEAEHRWIEGVDRTGTEPIDRRLGVLKLESLDGKPIAFLLNYGMEPVVAMAMQGEISGDVPGAASRYVEDRYKGDAVALFTIGSTGSPMYRARPGGADPKVLIGAMGTILGEEALATANGMRMSTSARLAGAHSTLECPGKITTPLNLGNQCSNAPGSKAPACVFTDKDAPPVTLNLGLLRIGDLALVEVDANVSPVLWLKLAAASPVTDTALVALTYGPLHYAVDDASYPMNTYEATASTAKQGCIEKGFISGELDLLEKTR
jgi:hypothetical protein